MDGRDIGRWRSLQVADPALANPFLSPEYAIAVSTVRPQARVAVLPRGFFAFEAHASGLGLPIGSGLSDQQATIGPARVDARELVARCGLHALRFENVPDALLPSGVGRVVRYRSPLVDLSDGYVPFLESRRRASKGRVQAMQRKRRKLEREVGPLRFEFQSADRAALRAVMRWKSQQYAALGEWDRFADPATIELVDMLHATQAPGCTGTLSVLYAGDEIAAAHFGLRSRQVLTSWFPSYNPELSQYSPGLSLHFLMAESAAERGISTFDLGCGEHAYKDLLSTGKSVLTRGWAFRGTVRGLAHRAATAPGDGVRSLARRSPRLRSTLEGARDALLVARRGQVRRVTPAEG